MEDRLQKDSLRIAEERLKAQMAMEGEERRKKREQAIRQAKEQEDRARQEEERKKREIFEREKFEKEEREQEIRAAEERKETSEQLQKNIEEVKSGGDGLRTIRTLKNDQADLIARQSMSVIGIAIKEEERARQRQADRALSSGKNLATVVVSAVLILLGLGAILYVYNYYYAAAPLTANPASKELPAPLLFADKSVALDVAGMSTDELIARIKNEIQNPPDLLLGAVENFMLTKKDGAGAERPLATGEFFKAVGATPPDGLSRILGNEYLFGVLSSAENAGFIIIKVESYDIGWAGLLDWESKTMVKDIYPVLTGLKPDLPLLAKPFEDLTIKNIDTRVLKDGSGAVRIVYGFLDGDKTIAIAGSQQAFIEALNRFNTPQPVSR